MRLAPKESVITRKSKPRPRLKHVTWGTHSEKREKKSGPDESGRGVKPPQSKEKLGRAVGVALEDAEVDGPGADGLAVLVGHDAGELMQVSEVMGGPSGQEGGQGN
jgi:hypothetical protein